MKLLLDTCSFLWLSQQPSMLSAAAVAAIDEEANQVFVSDVSLWEIVLKHTVGKLPLPDTPRIWIPLKLEFHQLAALAVDRPSILRSGELPLVHTDPFDRLLAAQAIEHGFTIISPDTPLSLLGASRIW